VDFMEAVVKRRTYRGQFINKPISQKDLDTIIEAARWAPSPFNTQPWAILIITQKDKKHKLAKLMLKSMSSQMGNARFLQDASECMSLIPQEWLQRGEGVMMEDHMDVPGFIKDKTKLRPVLKNAKNLSFLGKLGLGKVGAAKFVKLIEEAPALILVLMDKKKKSPGENGKMWKVLGMGAFIQNIILAATSIDIGTHIVNATLETKKDRQKLKDILSIPDNYEPVTMLRAGYYNEPPGESVRLNPEKFVHYEEFGE